MIKKLIALPTALALVAILGFGAIGSVDTAEAQVTGPRVAIQLLSNGLTSPLVAGATDSTMARLVLDTTGSTEAVRINSLPFALTVGAGANAAHLMNCRVINEANPNTALNSAVTMQAGLNNVALSESLVLAANTVTTVAVRCDVSADLVASSTYTFSMNTANLTATGVTSGLPALVLVRGAVAPTPVVPVPVPGLPTTGAAGEAPTNALLLLGSALLAFMGVSYALRTEKRA